jgi:uncharacterized membrane protein YfcA
MSIPELLLLALAAAAGGAINSVAGGGTFITFPLLLFVGVPAISANATNSLGMWIGGLGSIGAYRRELTYVRHLLVPFSIVALLGGLAGAGLLLITPERTFLQLIPFLLLGATVLFAFGGRISAALRKRFGDVSGKTTGSTFIAVLAFQFLVAVYGGYFGAGQGILMLAAFAVLGLGTIHVQNSLKVVLGALINGVAALAFVFAGIIHWPAAIAMTLGVVVGGYGGASLARRMPPAYVRLIVIFIGVSLTIYYFIDAFILS